MPDASIDISGIKKLEAIAQTLESKAEQAAFISFVNWSNTARKKQFTPEGDWSVWLILAGRGWGKTRTGGEDIVAYALSNPNVRCGVVAPTRGDLRRVCFEGDSGLLKIIPDECYAVSKSESYNRSAMEITLFNGSVIQGFAAIEPDRLRGPQFHRIWADEVAAWRYPESYDQMMFGLRLGDDPRLVITTTPRATPLIVGLAKREGKDVHLTRGSTFENYKNLAETALQQLKDKYEGTRLGRQELYADILEEQEGALWNYGMIDSARISRDSTVDFQRVVVAIDPAVTNTENSDETGIVVCGSSIEGRFYVIDDLSGKYSADGWGKKAIEAYYKYSADRIVAEVNNGGDLVERLLRNIDNSVPYTPVNASRGKIIRAEPIAALYEQGKVHHVGAFSELEDQMCFFTQASKKSPDRMDALVWALTELSQTNGQAYWRIS